MKDSAIASQIAREAGLRAQVQDTKVTQRYVIQSNQSDWEFLQRRAGLLGYEIYVRDKVLYFRWPQSAAQPADKLSLGEDITEFSPRLSSLTQVSEVAVRGWDVKQKKAVVAGPRARPPLRAAGVPAPPPPAGLSGQPARPSSASPRRRLAVPRHRTRAVQHHGADVRGRRYRRLRAPGAARRCRWSTSPAPARRSAAPTTSPRSPTR